MSTITVSGTSKESAVIRWLLKAVSNDPQRSVLQHIYVQNGKTVSTDGWRMFIAPTPSCLAPVEGSLIAGKVKPGTFTAAFSIYHGETKFPPYETVIPRRCANELWFKADHLKRILTGNFQQVAFRLNGKNYSFNARLFLDAIAGLKPADDVCIRLNSIVSGPFVLLAKDRLACIMPMYIGRGDLPQAIQTDPAVEDSTPVGCPDWPVGGVEFFSWPSNETAHEYRHLRFTHDPYMPQPSNLYWPFGEPRLLTN